MMKLFQWDQMMKTLVSISSILSMTALLQSKYVHVCNFISSFKMCEFTWSLPFIIWINSYTYPKDVLFLPACFPGNLSEADVKRWFLVSVIHTHVFNRNIESGQTFFRKIWVEWLKKIYIFTYFSKGLSLSKSGYFILQTVCLKFIKLYIFCIF